MSRKKAAIVGPRVRIGCTEGSRRIEDQNGNRDINERSDVDEVDPAMVRLLEWGTSLIELYRFSALNLLLTDTSRAWLLSEIFDTLVGRQLVPQPGNKPVLKLALSNLVARGDIARIVTGYYRADWPQRDHQ